MGEALTEKNKNCVNLLTWCSMLLLTSH